MSSTHFSTIGLGYGEDFTIRVDIFELVDNLDNPLDPNALIQELGELFLPQPILETQVVNLKEVLIPGLPDFEWTVEYNKYLENPEDEAIKASVELKLRSLLRTLLSMPEYYLS